MKKLLLISLMLLSFAAFSQKPAVDFKPSANGHTNLQLVGNYDTACHCYKDTLWIITEGENPVIWSNKKIDTKNSVKNVSVGIYIADLAQTGTGIPNENTVYYNTIGTIVWSRISPGVYVGTKTGAFPVGNTHLSNREVMINSSTGAIVGYAIFHTIDADRVGIQTFDTSGTPVDDVIGVNVNWFKIEVYP